MTFLVGAYLVLISCLNWSLHPWQSLWTTSNRQIITGVESAKDVDLSVFVENGPTQFQMKVLVAH